ncbi:putative Transcription factor IIIB 90 kDa subunit [Hypsibius exemplaris]|uniref:General transcription factor TFIIB n=1 Tax=Hypsibius exemplaris TaxID=2072580 RepID=A0A1W0WMN7_HYPEX|nr:putative Transcription factor IIIB 90 kDa subunit [Hypsibius exemplaris]
MADPAVGGMCVLCGSFEIETDYSKGEAFCNTCGAVQEEELITNSVQYEAGNSGHNTLVGRNVNLGAEGYLGQTGNPMKGGIARSSKDTTLSKNEDRLRGLGTQSKCGPDICNHGFRVYKMAYEAGMTRKRPLETVLCACLYIASRRMKTGHMLADFVHLLNGDIYDLAKTVRFFITRLCISVPMLDPMMQVERFCHELVNDRVLVPKLVNLAHRIVERMKKDWIDAGRKPGAVAAAAVIIACRVNNYEVDLDRVARVAQVAGVTIRRRLLEFAQTESAKLLPSQFETEDLPRAPIHPCLAGKPGNARSDPKGRAMDDAGRKRTAKCLKALLKTTKALTQKGITEGEDLTDLQHGLVCLNTSIEMTESRWQLTLEKSLFIATDLKVSITDDEFEGGRNTVCRDFLQSLMTNEAEQAIRRGNLQGKHGELLSRRADKKRELQEEQAERPRKQARKKAAKTAAGRPSRIPKPAEVQKSNKIDYDRFNDYLKDFDGSSNVEHFDLCA